MSTPSILGQISKHHVYGQKPHTSEPRPQKSYRRKKLRTREVIVTYTATLSTYILPPHSAYKETQSCTMLKENLMLQGHLYSEICDL